MDMERGLRTGRWGGALIAIVVAAGVVGVGHPATADQGTTSAAAITRIKMVDTKRGPAFRGPSTVRKGSRLRIVNRSNPRTSGPHTFTLITGRDLPRTVGQKMRCGQLKGVCGDIAVAHELDPKTFVINKPNVDVGRPGWDKRFGKTGDSWYTEKKGEITGRTVSAPVGAVLRFFCVVHPFMQSKIKVVR
jgi:hypothetical protein